MMSILSVTHTVYEDIHLMAMYKNNWFYSNTITMSLNIVVLLCVHYVIVLQIAIKQNLLSAFDTA